MILGDVRAALRELGPNSWDLLWTSPPFFNLRDYLDAEHEHKTLEIGKESKPAAYIATMLDIVELASYSMTRHGSIAFEIGDTRSGSGGAGGDYLDGGLREGQNRYEGSAKARNTRYNKPDGPLRSGMGRSKVLRPGHPPDKSLYGIPTIFAWSLAYGRNLLAEPMLASELMGWIDGLVASGMTHEQALAFAGGWVAEHGDDENSRNFDPWRIRNLGVWHRPNPPVGATGDRFRDSCSYVTMACRSRTRWFDLDAVRHDNPTAFEEHSRSRAEMNRGSAGYHTSDDDKKVPQNQKGAPPLDHWKIAPAQYRGSHYAVMPTELCVLPIEAQCPRRVCLTCAEPSRRIVNVAPSPYNGDDAVLASRRGKMHTIGATGARHLAERVTTFVGWTSCGCPGTGDIWEDGWAEVYKEVLLALRAMRKRGITNNERETIRVNKVLPLYDQLARMYRGRTDGLHEGIGWRAGVVLDPFFGTGTTGVVASQLGRDCIGIDLDPDNVDLASERLGMFLDEVHSPL